jgi:hypothetical protein
VYVILTSKPGQFRTEAVPGVEPVERWDYVFYGRVRARFVIARLERDVRVRVVDEADPELVNLVPSKLLEKHDTIERARAALRTLTTFGDLQAELVRVDATAGAAA